jgi:hypothetical protein
VQFIDEMNGITKAELEDIKAIISDTEINYRLLYHQRRHTGYQNSTFIGTCNPPLKDLLRDTTSARRFWEVRCKDVMDWNVINNINYNLIWTAVSAFEPSPINNIHEEIFDIQDNKLRNKEVYQQFVDACLKPDDSGYITADQLYMAYKSWAKNQDYKISGLEFALRRICHWLPKNIKKERRRIKGCKRTCYFARLTDAVPDMFYGIFIDKKSHTIKQSGTII